MGNEAVVEAALAVGCTFFAGYPITPSTEIAELLARRLPQAGGTFIQMEDEIASLGAVIGASIAGAKAMTATSGPGFSLMQENIGYAIVAEVPCVIVNVMRGGPSSGLPTMPEQGDVMQARWGTHGDHLMIVLAASTVRDSFDVTVRAFNLAEKFRTPVIVLSDETVAHTREKVVLPEKDEVVVVERPRPQVPPEWYIPYEDTPSGVPAMARWGQGYRNHVTGLIHDIRGFPTQRPDEIAHFKSRLTRKIIQHIGEITWVEEYFLDSAEVAVVAYGSVFRSALSAVREARKAGVKAGLLKLVTLFPFPDEEIKRLAKKSSLIVVPELNQGQIAREVERAARGLCSVERLGRIDGRLIGPKEIIELLTEVSHA